MESQQVQSIMRPYAREVTLNFTVAPEDKLTTAVERMLRYNTNRIAVVRNHRPVGVIRLADALKKLGLEIA